MEAKVLSVQGEEREKMRGFHVRLSYINTILIMIGICYYSQAWREGGTNMEEGLFNV